MEKRIRIYNKEVSYLLKKSNRAKRMRIAVYHDGKIIVTIPDKALKINIEKYIQSKSKWIESKINFYNRFRNNGKMNSLKFNDLNKNKALFFITKRLNLLKSKYKLNHNLVTIKNQKTIWGSCSRRNNLSFNFKILLLKPNIREYIIAHEFCHLKIKNHSRKFWLLVGKILPNYKLIKEESRRYNLNIS